MAELESSIPRTARRSHTGLVMDEFFALHITQGEPDSPSRIPAIARALEEAGLMEKLVPLPSRDATIDEIHLVHSAEYIETVRTDVEYGADVLSTGDTALCENSLLVALRATGGVLQAVDAVMRGETSGGVRNAFCAIRPPGHHATPTRGMGFCIFNHVAIAARYAQRFHGVGKVLIVDWDVHHGNGTQDAFYEDDSVLYFSSHQYPLYPGTGKRSEVGTGRGEGFNINAPLPAGSGYKEILAAIEGRLEPKLNECRPDLILISAGFDSRIGDPLGDFVVEDREFALLTERAMQWADAHCGGRIVSVLEGGYNLETLGGAVAAYVGALMA